LITLRPYQQDAHDAIINHWKKSTLPICIEATTGAGKSLIVAEVAKTLFNLSGGKRVLCLAPSKELIEQNAEKYELLGEKCSIYSASISKSLRHQVIFATEGTFKKVAKRLGNEFAGVIVDECHRITPTIKTIISDMQEGNPNLRVCGLSATPFRLGDGYIYGIDENDNALDPSVSRDPYFYKCVYKITARQLIEQGFLTPLVAGEINAQGYDTSSLQVQGNGQYSNASIKSAFEGWGRKTSAIVADIVAQTQEATGVMIFAATVQHAQEVMASLHPDNARLVTGETPKAEREQILKDFKSRKFLYIVNVSVLTTGFDAPNVSHIAILRATESISLLQQIMGRGMRLYEGKPVCTILDYAGNIEKHMPEGDLYKPGVRAKMKNADGELLQAKCETCLKINEFSARKNEDNFDIDENGYYVDSTGERIMVECGDEFKPMPAHWGRRCNHYDMRSGERCTGRWTFKSCPVCEADNDIAARYCHSCKAEIVNPNEKLIAIHTAHKKDPTQWQTDEVISIDYESGISKAGNAMITATVKVSRRVMKFYLLENNQWAAQKKEFFAHHTSNFTQQPRTITYRKKDNFWEVNNFNAQTDEEKLQCKLNMPNKSSLSSGIAAPTATAF